MFTLGKADGVVSGAVIPRPRPQRAMALGQQISHGNMLGSPGGLKKRVVNPTPRVSDSAGLGGGLESLCISKVLPGGGMLLAQGPHFEDHLSRLGGIRR